MMQHPPKESEHVWAPLQHALRGRHVPSPHSKVNQKKMSFSLFIGSYEQPDTMLGRMIVTPRMSLGAFILSREVVQEKPK